MTLKQIALTLLGIILILNGSLWFVQGTGIVKITPIYCVAECQPLTGPSPLWMIAGAVLCIVGLLIVRGSHTSKTK